MEFSTIHIFAYGESQIISKDLNFKSSNDNFKNLQAVIDNVKSNKPEGVAEKDFHAINIFKLKSDYNAPDSEGSFSVPFQNLDSNNIDALITEFQNLKDADDKAKADSLNNK
ncbi:MAG TPA: hypothetical protein VN026_18260 [Bacteroidia bacterium]|jgi:hypothetical protein|nr:hypothetical protein [Bacteroidia bacterium]